MKTWNSTSNLKLIQLILFEQGITANPYFVGDILQKLKDALNYNQDKGSKCAIDQRF